MDWFEALTGFRETDYQATRQLLRIEDGRLYSARSPRSYAVGTLETPTLAELRERARPMLARAAGRSTLTCQRGEARGLHADVRHEGALFQVASQFNLLEMTGPDVTPEDGVTRYADDATQGPACAMAAGAATVYRNYFAPVDGGVGQTRERQIDCLRDLGFALGHKARDGLWRMRNGYALCSADGLTRVDERLEACSPDELDDLRAKLRIGLHWHVELTDPGSPGRLVSQAFCSALPISYSRLNLTRDRWRRFATLVLEAAYEATLLAAVINRDLTGSPLVFLTSVGGGVFGNDAQWIRGAIGRALKAVGNAGLDIRIVSFGAPSMEMLRLVEAIRER